MSAAGISFTELIAYNPALNYDCSALAADEAICVSPPGGTYTPTLIPGAGLTTSATYATATVAPPGLVPKGTTSQCGKYYEAQVHSLPKNIQLMPIDPHSPAISASRSP